MHERTTMSAQRAGGNRPSYLSAQYRSPGEQVHRRPSAAVLRRRRRVVAGLALGLVLLVALLTAFVWPGFARPDDEPLPAVTVTAPVPSPTVEPAGRPENQTAFLKAMPDSTLQLAVREVKPHTPWEDNRDAIEAWRLTYVDGNDPAADGAAVVQLVAGQWEDADEAGSVLDSLLEDAGEPTTTGDVTVDGEKAGTYAVTPGSDEGTSVVTWRNGTAVLQATGPTDLVQEFYTAFPL